MSEDNYLYAGASAIVIGMGGIALSRPKALRFSVDDSQWLKKVEHVTLFDERPDVIKVKVLDPSKVIKGNTITIPKPGSYSGVIFTGGIRRNDTLTVSYKFNKPGYDITGSQTLFEEQGGKLIKHEEALLSGRTPKSTTLLGKKSLLAYFGVALAGVALIYLWGKETRQKSQDN